MDLSLVISTRNRAPQLERCLESLKKLRYAGPWELVVVDNGSTDETPGVIARFGEEFPQGLVTAVERRTGAGHARNTGWRLARGEIIVFTDDDCYPAPDYLETTARCFRENPGLGFVGGRILLFDPEDYPTTIQISHVGQTIRPGDFITTGLIHGANCAFRRAALEAAGGFDPPFGAGALYASCEDVDLITRVSANGWEGAYDPRPLVYHHHGRKTSAEAARLTKLYDRGRGAFYAKCILNPALRPVYLKNWYWLTRYQPIRITLRELVAGLEFLTRSCFLMKTRERGNLAGD